MTSLSTRQQGQAPALLVRIGGVEGSPWKARVSLGHEQEHGPARVVAEGLTEQERRELAWYLERRVHEVSEAGNLVRAARAEVLIQAWGERMWDALCDSTAERWLSRVQQSGGGRLVICPEHESDELVFRSPWELLRPKLNKGRVWLRGVGVETVRQVEVARSRHEPGRQDDGDQPLRVLVVVSRPDDLGFLDLRHTTAELLDTIDSVAGVEVTVAQNATLREFRDQIVKAGRAGCPYQVIHFDGHGLPSDTGSGLMTLAFETRSGLADLVNAEALAAVISTSPPQLLVLEACHSAKINAHGEALAAALTRESVAAVLAMGWSAHVDLTRHFMKAFYAAWTAGEPLERAVGVAREAAFANPARRIGFADDAGHVNLQDWWVPHLYRGGAPLSVGLRRCPIRLEKTTVEPLIGFPRAGPYGFVGRVRDLHRIQRLLLEGAVVVHGPSGVGKTELARAGAAWWTRIGLFQRAVLVTLDDDVTPSGVAQRVAGALLGQEAYDEPDVAHRLLGALQQQPTLIVLDNVESLLPSFGGSGQHLAAYDALLARWCAAGGRILLTARTSQLGLANVQPYPLDELSIREATWFLQCALKATPVNVGAGDRIDSIGDLEALAASVHGHPLSMALLVPHLARRSATEVLRELSAQAMPSSNADVHTQHPLRASLSLSAANLSPPSREALVSVGLLTGGALDTMCPVITGLAPEMWREVALELEATGLLRTDGYRIWPHPVLLITHPGTLSDEAHRRLVTTANSLAKSLEEVGGGEHAADAMAVFILCETVLVRAAKVAIERGLLVEAWLILDTIQGWLERARRGEDAVALFERFEAALEQSEGVHRWVHVQVARERALRVAIEDPDAAVEMLDEILSRLPAAPAEGVVNERALTLAHIGRIHYDLRNAPDKAVAYLTRAARLFAMSEERDGFSTMNRSATLGDLCNALSDLQRWEEALDVSARALKLDQDRGDVSAAARSLGQLARIHYELGSLSEAEIAYRDARNLALEAADEESLATTETQLGSLLTDTGRIDEGLDMLQQALASCVRLGRTHEQVEIMNNLGGAEVMRDRYEQAIAWYERATELADQCGDALQAAVAQSNIGLAHARQAEDHPAGETRDRLLALAISSQRQAAERFHAIGVRKPYALALFNLSVALWRAGETSQAEMAALQALPLYESMNIPDIWRVHHVLERTATERGDQRAAADWAKRRDAAQAEAIRRSEPVELSPQTVRDLLAIAASSRHHKRALQEALEQAGESDYVLELLRLRAPWLIAHMDAMAAGSMRPDAGVPDALGAIVDEAWAQLEMP